MPTKESNKNKNKVSKKKDIHEQPEKNESSYISNAKKRFQEDEDIIPDVKQVLDDVFTDMIEGTIEDNTVKVNGNEILSETNELDTETSSEADKTLEIQEFITIEKDKDLKAFYENKLKKLEEKIEEYNSRYQKLEETIKRYEDRNRELVSKRKELEEKIEEYNSRYQKLEETTQSYEDRNRELVSKRKEFEESIKEFEHKSKALEESKNDFNTRSEKLKEAREHFIELNKQWEMKRTDLEKKVKEIRKIQWTFEKNEYEFEKKKIDFEREKLDFEIGKSELERIIAKEKDIKDYSELVKDKEIIVKKEKKLIGKAEVLQSFLQKLSIDGIFQSCFLIDSKGMMVSEYVKTELDSMAIGAMFSLFDTIALKTVASLHLQELNFFKLSTANGEFLAKNINISNYERDFVLLAYYDGVTPTIPNSKQKMDKKTINKIIKSIKEDFFEFGHGRKISWIFDNLTEKINFLKQKYSTPETDIELIRSNLLNKTTIQIKELFEEG